MFWRAAIFLALVRWSLRLRGYGKTFASLKKRVHFQDGGVVNPLGPQDELVRASCRMVRAALRYSFANYTCLEESLTLWYLLRRQGVAACLRIGVRKEGGIFEAHAWVELGGEALNQDGAMHRHYSAFEQELTEPPREQP
jgi:hypothetical protein